MNDQDLDRGMSNMTSNMTMFIVGAAVGAGIALLLAPDRGSETRRRLGQTAKRLSSTMRDNLGDLKSNVQSAVDSGRDAFRRERDNLQTSTQSGMNQP